MFLFYFYYNLYKFGGYRPCLFIRLHIIFISRPTYKGSLLHCFFNNVAHLQESYFFSHPDAPQRTRKHIPSPARRSACKRLNMYLRWMVRSDNNGVDFGLWKKVKPKDLICPLDLHVERTARKLGLLHRDKPDWQAALELTGNLRLLDAADPVKYDFALFGISIEEKCIIDRI